MTDKQFTELSILIWLIIILLGLSLGVQFAHAEPAPQDTLITFTDGADLQRQALITWEWE